ncbi:MAG: transketolase [Limnobacter sp.]|jgi:transketolase|uniref:transketolase n=3 Tax=Limnobacter TaxID=131079 RepID=UPI000C4D517F|nr:transketolase [Limnobacter sp. UBA6514]MAG81148.1 transketolase [Sutterellaceae bacterium]MBT85454.1 transketolase [Sutterellaceae bacterium]RZO91695.1 MAG: transketolase [Limnobacter sp.]HAV74370.1 transketolase [Limnobacter sp.]
MSSSSKNMANAIRALAMDAVQAAKSGHPGMPMGMAEIAVALWARHLKHNPQNPLWADRDRFVLSNGHGSMLIYALLHLTGYDLPIEELKNFRQLHSKTPGHPEVDITPGVETTTGPLGQGIANAVGLALAEKLLAAEFNEAGFPVVDHNTYVFLGDGCLMEGISHEACSLAGTLGLSKLIVMYDDNGISIDGEVEHWFADNTPKRFEAYGWNVIPNVNGHDVDAVDAAIAQAKQNAALDKGPTLICCKTNIGEGSPNLAGTDKVHGAPLGEAEIAATRAAIGWEHAPFEIPAEVYNAWDAQVEGAARQSAWDKLFEAYSAKFPAKAAEFKRRMAGDLPAQFEQTAARLLAEVAAKGETIATRKASQNAITLLAAELPELLGGSADLTGSNLTNWPKCVAVRRNTEGFTAGNHINWGVREFGMSAALNGVALHGGYIPFGATFLTFSDYSRNALRMAALMKKRNIFVFTHDSIGLGEDGPTHQPVEHAATLRLLPNMDVWRPADSVESMAAWNSAVMRKDGPSSLLFSRQNLPFLARSESVLNSIVKGGYVLVDVADAKVTLIATGSEIEIAMNTQKALAEKGIAARVVSMPSTNVFDRQAAAYKAEVLGTAPIAVIEAGMTDSWYKYIAQAGVKGTVLGMSTFGESAPAGALFKHFGLTTEKFTEAALALVQK